jgi:hypothetical protein
MERNAENETSYHLARLLLLIAAFGRGGKPIDGLTKIAKLDFLLRYPAFFERLLQTDGLSWPEGAEPTAAERRAVESTMIRYKYGPWDNRYYPLIGALLSRGLAERTDARGRIALRLTELGKRAAEEIAREPAWQSVVARAALLAKNYNVSGSRLQSRIYKELPEVVDRPHWAEIS